MARAEIGAEHTQSRSPVGADIIRPPGMRRGETGARAKASPFKGRWHGASRDGEVEPKGFACTIVGALLSRYPTSQSPPATAPLKRGAIRMARAIIGAQQTRLRSPAGG